MTTGTPSTLARPRRPAERGFTLIEMMAVVMIIGMVFAIGVPQLGGSKRKRLENEAESIAASLQFARQRAVMTGIPHRLLVDLEEGGYRIEWFVTDAQALGGGGDGGLGALGGLLGGLGDEPPSVESISLRPPTKDDRQYVPIGHRKLGSFSWIDDAVYFVGLESAAGWIEGGDVAIVFHADGTTEYSLLELADSDDNHLTLEIEPILDRVGRREGTARS